MLRLSPEMIPVVFLYLVSMISYLCQSYGILGCLMFVVCQIICSNGVVGALFALAESPLTYFCIIDWWICFILYLAYPSFAKVSYLVMFWDNTKLITYEYSAVGLAVGDDGVPVPVGLGVAVEVTFSVLVWFGGTNSTTTTVTMMTPTPSITDARPSQNERCDGWHEVIWKLVLSF